jgi:hypothetical protein
MSPRAMNTQVTFQFLQFAFQRFRLRVLACYPSKRHPPQRRDFQEEHVRGQPRFTRVGVSPMAADGHHEWQNRSVVQRRVIPIFDWGNAHWPAGFGRNGVVVICGEYCDSSGVILILRQVSVLAHCIYNCNAIQFGQTRCPTSLNFQPSSRSGLGRGQSLGGMASYRAVNRQAAREPVKASEPPGIPSGSFASRRVCLVMSRPTLSDRTASRRVCVTYKAPALTASH